MIGKSEEYVNAIRSASRQIRTRVFVNYSDTPLIDEISSVSIDELSTSGDIITVGDLCSNTCTVSFYMNEPLPLINSTIKIEHGLLVEGEYQWVNCGTFYVQDEIEKNAYSSLVTVKGYDGSIKLNKTYEPTVEFPCPLIGVLVDIVNQCGIVLQTVPNFDYMIEGIPENVTCRDMIKYLAGIMGKNARVNRNDLLEFYWYSKNPVLEIDKSLQMMNTLNMSADDEFTVDSISCSNGTEILVVGEGKGITFENPYMTLELLNNMKSSILGYKYYPLTMNWRGNPCLEIGDRISVENSDGTMINAINCNNVTVLTGMSSTLTSKAKATDSIGIGSSPTDIKLQKLYHTLQGAFKRTTENIIGHNGGYFTIDTDSNGFPTGWSIMNTPTLRDDTHLWKFTSGGLGYSTNGGKTFDRLAFDLEGNFNAYSITTGVIQGEMFELDLEKGTVKFGKRNDEGVIENPTLYLDEMGNLEINNDNELGIKEPFKTVNGTCNLTSCSIQHPLIIEKMIGESRIEENNIVSLEGYLTVNDERVAIPTLRSVPSLNLADTWENGKISRKVAYVTYTGAADEQWEYEVDCDRFYIRLKVDCIINGRRQQVLCNRGKFRPSGHDDETTFVYGAMDDVVSRFYYYPPKGINTVAKFKEWLQDNPLQVCYQLPTPYEETLSDYSINDINSMYANADGECVISHNVGVIEGYYYTKLANADMIQSTKPPTDKNILWCDTSTNPALIKRYNYSTNEWEEVVDTQQIKKWAKYSDGELTLGQNDSPFKMKLTNTKLGFYDGKREMSYFANERMHISKASIDENIDIANQVRFLYMKNDENEGIGIVPIV